MTDRELLSQFARTGSQEAYAEIVRRHAGAVYGTCLRVLGNAHEAEDAAQGAFLVFLRKGRALPGGTVLLDWLHRTARNAARNLRREDLRRARREEEAAAMAGHGDEGRGARPARRSLGEGGDEATWEQVRPHLDAALDDLPAAQRQALKLHYLRGLTRAEVAAELACPERTVESRLRLGLEKLRERLSRRGAVVPAAALLGFLGRQVLSEQAPSTLIASIQALGTAPAAASVAASATAEAVMKVMMWAKVKFWAAGFAAAALLATGGAVLATQAMAEDIPAPKPIAEARPLPAPDGARSEGPKPAGNELAAEENAATYYRRAIAALPALPSEEMTAFLIGEALNASPEVIKEMPGAPELIQSHDRAVDLTHQGALLNKCDFEVDWSEGVGVKLPHLLEMRDLARRTIAWGRHLEAQDRTGEVSDLEAAERYLDVVRMGCHLDQDNVLIGEMVGLACTGMGVQALQRQMSRGIGEMTAQRILNGLEAVPARPFDFSAALEKERQMFGGWVFARLISAAEKDRAEFFREMNRLGGGPNRNDREMLKDPAFWLLPSDQGELVKLLKAQHVEYDRLMGGMIEASKGRFFEIRGRMQTINDEINSRLERKQGPLDLLGLTVPAVGRIYVSVARGESRMAATRLLAAACLEKARTGKFPESLDGLKPHFPKGLPVDPFTGRDFRYRVENGLPTVECEGDDPELKKRRPETYVFSLSEIKRRQEEAAERWRAERRGEKPPSLPAAPEPFPGEAFEIF